ncbi:hypothetical protein [Vreelandella hamiltonii]|uniref:hypothetical protein n=1 Tax=Vreelandella hamiltonii TaxID=502829 RepID=UPI00167B7B83|nr:hypothetical protein [Halomonas hamiltonii]
MNNELDLELFSRLRASVSGTVEPDIDKEIMLAGQSIHRWLKYCLYHYSNLPHSSDRPDLVLDRIGQYRRGGESVEYRYVYEANIIGFLNSLHALLDSFPHLLNLVIPTKPTLRPSNIRWSEDFINRYESHVFYSALKGFMIEKSFNVVKSYVNIAKHRHLIRVANNWDVLEFEEFEAKLPVVDDRGKIVYRTSHIHRRDAVQFLMECHDELVPKFFDLCRDVTSSCGFHSVVGP